jgi:small subunit ribosomal protein S17e
LGKVRTETVKRAARELLERFPDKFTDEYEGNKLKVKELMRSPSKKLRNRIAGYVTRLKAIEAQRATMMQVGPEAELGLSDEDDEQSDEQTSPPAA